MLIQREGMTGLMNNTKWREAILALREVPLSYRLKILTRTEPSAWSDFPCSHLSLNLVWPLGLGFAGPVNLVEMEWLEIYTHEKRFRGHLLEHEEIDHFLEVQAILSSLNVPYVREENIVRIYGYIRSID